MSCTNLFKLCCGEGEEALKYGAFVSSDSSPGFGWEYNGDTSTPDEKERIQRIEEKVTLINRHRSKEVRPGIRGTIACKPIDMTTNYEPPSHPKSEEDVEFLMQALRDSLMIVLDLDDSELKLLCSAMEKETVPAGTMVIEKGDMGDFYYIIDSGEVAFVDPDNQDNVTTLSKAGRGEAFGELALLYDSPRSVSCIASDEGPVTLWKVDQLTFRYLLAHHYQADANPLKDKIRNIEIFKDLNESIVSKFVAGMSRIRWKEGDQIVVKGEVGNIFYIIEEGEVKLHDIGLGDSKFEDQVLSAGDSFGERALLTGEPRAANATALTDVTTRAMDRETFERSIGPLQSVLERHLRRQYLASLPLFSQLSSEEIDEMVDCMVEVCYRKDDKLAEAGKPYDPLLWIIRHGRLLVFDTKEPDQIYSLAGGDHFGEESIRYPGRISTQTAVCEEDVTAWMLTREDIEDVAWDIETLSEPSRFSITRQVRPLMMDDLIKVKMLGHGGFGKVWLVKAKDEAVTTAFALKVISKRLILDSKQVQSVIREKQLLALFHHQFIVHLVSAFQDSQYLYLVLPVVPGGELYSIVENQKSQSAGLPNENAAFYAACVLEALIHFHQRNVAYRDLKLENILVDEEGYCRIIDLGFAKVVNEKTYTLVGTPDYLAPEVITSKGYDKACDLWSFGVLVFELIVGHAPFVGPGSRMDMFRRIVQVQYEFPCCVTDNAKDFIRNLLIRRPTDRLGNRALGHAETKKHAWFKETKISFKSIMARTQESPWKPVVKDPLKLSSFDDYSYLENEEEDYGLPLTDEEQALFAEF
ncbi:hypothetical protein MPSEU_001086500 [Mayamaea pseudoterrestris]|nr:hypothetical protein MPSEU_001086500 [Mayamaea pseudoterrestris]